MNHVVSARRLAPKHHELELEAMAGDIAPGPFEVRAPLLTPQWQMVSTQGLEWPRRLMLVG
jgi:hypothetical protein